MFIRAQFTTGTFISLLRFRAANAARPCSQLLLTMSVPNQKDIRYFIRKFQLVNIANPALAPLSTPVSYPNNAPPPVQTFQRQRLILDLNFDVVAAFLDDNYDPFPDSTGNAVVTIAVSLDIEGGEDVLKLEILAANAQINVVYPPLPAVEGNRIINVSDQAKNILNLNVAGIGLIDQLDSLSAPLGGAALVVRHADLGFNPQTGMIEMRVETAGLALADAVASWTQFYANSFDTVQPGAPWAMFIDQRLMGSLISQQLTAELTGRGDFSMEGGLGVEWDPGFPGYHLSLRGEAIDACQCAWGKINVDVRVSIDIKFSIDGNQIRSDLWMDGHTTDATQVICCLLTAVALFPIVGLDFLESGKITWYEYLIGLVLYTHPVFLLVAAIAEWSSAGPPPLSNSPCQQDPGDDKHLICKSPVPHFTQAAACPGPALSLAVNAVTGRFDGLVFTGTLQIPQVVEPTIHVETERNLQYFPPTCSCSGPSSKGERFSATIFVSRAAGTYDFRVCKAQALIASSIVSTLRGGMEVDFEISDATCPYAAWITVSVPFGDYDYRPLRVLITTTHGALFVVLNPPALLSEADRARLQLAASAACVSQCYAKSRKWNPGWAVDPGDYVEQVGVRQLWVLAGVAVSDIGIHAGEGGTIATVRPGQAGAFRAAFLSGARNIVVTQNPVDNGALAGANLHVMQSLLAVDRQLSFRGAVVGIDPVRMSAVQRVLIYQAHQVSIYSVSEFGQLALLREIDTRHALWVRRVGTQLSWGAPGGQNVTIDIGGGQGKPAARTKPKRAPLAGGCGCHGSVPAVPEPEEPPASPEPAGAFDFMLQKETGCTTPGTRSRLSNNYWITAFEDVVVYQAADLKLANAASILSGDTPGNMLARVRSNVLLARGDDENTVQVLRVLASRAV